MPDIYVTRVERPALQGVDHDRLRSEVGGQWEWSWALANPYRAVNRPGMGEAMPAAPRRDADFKQYLGYWTSLQSFLTYSFGWTRHDRGLRWWYAAGKPVEDVRWALIDEVYERDGLLLRYAEWCHDRLSFFDQQALAAWTDYDGRSDELQPEWERELASAKTSTEASADSPHGMHLEAGDHSAGPSALGYRAELVVVSKSPPRAIYTSDSILGWYRGLVELSASLPEAPNRSWRVDVHVASVGLMGTYRRSRQTGLWFSGQHRYHTVGN